MDDIDAVLLKWSHAKADMDEIEKRIQRYRKQIDQFLRKNEMSQYENHDCKVRRQVQQRSVMTKKTVPSEIWEKYSTLQAVDCLVITTKKKKNSKQQQLDAKK